MFGSSTIYSLLCHGLIGGTVGFFLLVGLKCIANDLELGFGFRILAMVAVPGS